MPRPLRVIAVLLTVSAVAASSPPAGPGPLMAVSVESPGSVFAAVDELVRQEMAASAIPGVALGVARDGEVVHLAAFGIAGPDGRPMTTHTGVVIGSVGKSLTALAVRQLVEAGRLALQAPVSRGTTSPRAALPADGPPSTH